MSCHGSADAPPTPLTSDQLLQAMARRRTDEVVVATMSVVRPWGLLSDSALDFASADSAMGHAADLALGIAMARPERRVLCLNGDGSMLMSLGTLATVVEAGVENLALIVVNNGGYEITGNQPVAGAERLDFAAMARAAGLAHALRVDGPDGLGVAMEAIFGSVGPVLVDVHVAPGSQGPISRSTDESARYLKTSLYDGSRTLRAALAETSP